MEIAIALNTYDDLFSDFDIRGYRERALSRDFLDELHVRLRRAWREPELRIVFLIPSASRNLDDETLVIERVRRFFEERQRHYLRENRNAKLKFAVYMAVGLGLSVAANLVSFRLEIGRAHV